MQIVERSRRLLYLYTANVTESRRTIFLLTLVYEELLEMSLSSHFSTKDIISFLCSWIMIDVYKACVIDFWSKISLYNQIDFDFDSDIDWISKRSHSFNIKDSLMKVMSMTLVFIRVKDLNIFSKLFKMTSTMNDLKSNESSDMLMKQNMSILFSVTTLMKTDRFSNSQRSHALESF